MHQHRSVARIVFILSIGLPFAAISVGGCGGDRGPQRVVVSGTITYQGHPISEGRIRFVPQANSNAPSVAANIVEGRYRADLRGGVPVGTHKVEIEAYHGTPGAAPDPLRIPQNYLPRRHGTDSQVCVAIEPGSTQVTKDFTLTD